MPATPFLAVDLEVLDANIERTAAWSADRGIALRPHVKTHKCPEIALRQRDAGGSGMTVATIGEAEVFAQAGFDDLFIAYPLWIDEERHARLRRVSEWAVVTVGIDSAEGARRLVGSGVSALVEVDSGHHRTGVDPREAGELAAAAVAVGLPVVGVFAFPGHSYAPGGREEAAHSEADALLRAATSLRDAGVEPHVVSGGSSPSLAATGVGLSEVRPGVYVVNDAQQWELGACSTEQIALSCHATVVSHAGGRLILDAGSKVLGADRPLWASGSGRLLDEPQARILSLSEHHAVVDMRGGPLPGLGTVVRVVPNHACNAINLVDELFVVADGTVVDAWPVTARGLNA
ncbi:alanine racemase [Microbacterium sp.]|uniref:alanine racemase n=1 Tax=Microbacterium sp. TaxID=51671 RepID=UPI003A8B4079